MSRRLTLLGLFATSVVTITCVTLLWLSSDLHWLATDEDVMDTMVDAWVRQHPTALPTAPVATPAPVPETVAPVSTVCKLQPWLCPTADPSLAPQPCARTRVHACAHKHARACEGVQHSQLGHGGYQTYAVSSRQGKDQGHDAEHDVRSERPIVRTRRCRDQDRGSDGAARRDGRQAKLGEISACA